MQGTILGAEDIAMKKNVFFLSKNSQSSEWKELANNK